MAITEDGSTPAPVAKTGTATCVTAAFSPPAGSLLVALVSAGWGSGSSMTISVSDSVGGTWSARASAISTGINLGGVKIFTRYLATAPGSMTVTAAFTGLSGGSFMAVRVVNGAAADQSGAATATLVQSATQNTTGTVGIVPTVVGSQVYGISNDPDSAASWTANGVTTALSSGVNVNSTDSVTEAAWRVTATTASVGPTVTAGGTWGASSRHEEALLEILPVVPWGVTEHSSTPAVKTQNGNAASTTAAFSPPANSMLVAFVAMARGANQPTVTDSGGHTWTNRANASAFGTRTCAIAVFTCPLTTAPGSITVTATFDTVNVVGGTLLAVRVLTGADPDQFQFSDSYQSLQNNTATTAASMTATPVLPGSRIYGVSVNPDNTSVFTPTGATTVVATLTDATDVDKIVFWDATSLTPTPPASVTLGGTWITACSSANLWLEIEPPSATVSLDGVAAFAAAATTTQTYAGAATMAGAASLTATAVRTTPGAVALGGVAGLTTAVSVTEQTTTTLAGSAGLTAAGTKAIATDIALAATAALTTAGYLTDSVAATLSGVSALTAAGTRVQPGAMALAGIAALVAAGVPGSSVTFTAAAALATAAGQTEVAVVAISGTATLDGPVFVAERSAVAFLGTAGLTASLATPGTAALSGVASFTATTALAYPVTAALAGAAALTTTARVTVAGAVTFPGVAGLLGSPFRVAGGTGVVFSAVSSLRAAATGVTPGQVLAVSFWALNNDGTYNAALPDPVSWQLSLVESSPGAVTLDYPADGRNFDVLRASVTADRDLLIAVWVGGKDPGSLRAILNTAEGDDVAESGVWRFSGNFLNVRMEEAGVAPRVTVVTPPTGPGPTTDLAAFRVYAATAGTVVTTLMVEAHTRGALSDITYIFTNTVDSHGVPWSKTTTLKIAPGTDYLAVLTSLVEAQMCEWEIVDHELVLWEYGTRGVDYTLTIPPIILRAGDTLTDSPRKHTVRGAGTTLTVAGGEGLYTTTSDATALARRGRRIEQFFSQGTLTDTGSLSAYAAAKLPSITAGAMEVGGGVALTGTGPEPLIAYYLGDWLWYDTGLGLERLRIKQLTVSCDSDGVLTAGLSLNDLIADQLERLAQRLAGIEGGTTITGTSNASPIIPDAPDTVAPTAPNGLIVTSLAQPSAEAVPKSAVVATWAAPITNVDGTVCTDLSGYNVQWRYLNPALVGSWIQLAPVGPASTSWSGVIAGEALEVRVQAYDLTGNTSAWSASVFHTTQTDATPPPVPSTPVATEFLGTLTVTWDGRGSAGETMPADFVGVQIHRSTTTGFTPGSSTFVENMLGSGSRNYPDLPLGVTQFFKLISYDRTGNLSAPSAEASGVPAPVGMGDIAFSDPGNLVEDGSFEVGTSRATHTARSDTAWTFVSGGADNGTWFARGTGSVGSGLRALVLSPQIPTTPGSDYAIRWAMRATGVNGDVSMRVRWTLAATTTDTISTFTPGFSSAWTNTEVGNGVFTAPAGAVSLQIIVMLHANCTAGTWDLDRVEARETVGTLLVRNASITDAQIASASVGKLTAGTITAVMLMAGLLRSGTTGLRYELDANGLRFYNASNQPVIDLNRASASATITGTLQTGVTGQRVVISGPDNEIRFYPQAGETRYGLLYTYIPGNYPNDIAIELRANDSDSTAFFARKYLLPDIASSVVSPQGSGGDLLAISECEISTTYAEMSYSAITGAPPYSGTEQSVLARIFLDTTGLTLSCYTSGLTDGGYLYLNRGNTVTYLGKKTSGSGDSYLRFTGSDIEIIRSGSYVARFIGGAGVGGLGAEIYNGVYTSHVGGIASSRVSFQAEGGGEVFFFWSGGSLWFGSGSSAIKTFVIDHPQPAKADRYLVHSTTESPKAGVEYWGIAIVEDGQVEVTLPDYFEALTSTEDRVVLLTVVAETNPADRGRLPRRKPRTDHTPPPRVTRRIPTLGEAPAQLPIPATPVGTPTPAPPGPAVAPVEYVEVTDPALPTIPIGLPSQVQATVPRDGTFTIYTLGPVDTFRVFWLVKAKRKDVAQFDVEPLKAAGDVRGDGPYRFYVPR